MAEPEKKPAPPAPDAKKTDAAKGADPKPPAKEAEAKAKEGDAKEGDAAAAPAAPPPPNPLFSLIVLLGVLILLPAAGWATAKFILHPRIKAVRIDALGGPPVSDASGHGEKKDEGEKKGGHGGGAAEGEKAASFPLEGQVVNIAGTRGSRFLRAGMDFEGPPAVLEEMKKNEARIKDIVTTTLSSKRLDELEAADIRQKLRMELMTLINSALKKGQITSIYFTELIVQ
ncbi:MAG: flagellar basal body-associated FliL family protein [Verrucomicrobiae bacterium]|nr:flagellar basal body-associated FliL family protein [Verrucomicrobiae bacterium]